MAYNKSLITVIIAVFYSKDPSFLCDWVISVPPEGPILAGGRPEVDDVKPRRNMDPVQVEGPTVARDMSDDPGKCRRLLDVEVGSGVLVARKEERLQLGKVLLAVDVPGVQVQRRAELLRNWTRSRWLISCRRYR